MLDDDQNRNRTTSSDPTRRDGRRDDCANCGNCRLCTFMYVGAMEWPAHCGK
jgi:hypothetical protein